MNVGEKVLLPEYGGTKVVLEDKVRVVLYRDHLIVLENLHETCSKTCVIFNRRIISCSGMQIF